jgi:hypothetical protein
MSKGSWLVVGMVVAVLSGACASSLAGDRPPRAKKSEAAAKAVLKVDPETSRFLATLQPTEEQRRLLVEKSQAAAPVESAARQEARRIVAHAMEAASQGGAKPDRKAVLASVKGEVRTVLTGARAQIAPLAKEVVATFTAEQRQRLQPASPSKRTKTVGDGRLERLVSRVIGRGRVPVDESAHCPSQ